MSLADLRDWNFLYSLRIDRHRQYIPFFSELKRNQAHSWRVAWIAPGNRVREARHKLRHVQGRKRSVSTGGVGAARPPDASQPLLGSEFKGDAPRPDTNDPSTGSIISQCLEIPRAGCIGYMPGSVNIPDVMFSPAALGSGKSVLSSFQRWRIKWKQSSPILPTDGLLQASWYASQRKVKK